MIVEATTALCLALNIYYEARSEPFEGQIAVTQVVLNRVEDKRWPNTPCGVITQRGQFSWYTQGQNHFPLPDTKSWIKATRLATLILEYNYIDITDGAVYYHVETEDCNHKYFIKHGNHIFLKEL